MWQTGFLPTETQTPPVINFQLLPQDHAVPTSGAVWDSAPRWSQMHGKWQTVTKIKRESRKTFEHLLFVCWGTVSVRERIQEVKDTKGAGTPACSHSDKFTRAGIRGMTIVKSLKTRFYFLKGSVLRRRFMWRLTGAQVFDSTLKCEWLGSRRWEPFGVTVGLGSEMTEGGGRTSQPWSHKPSPGPPLFPILIYSRSISQAGTLENQGLNEWENLWGFLRWWMEKAARRRCEQAGAFPCAVCSKQGRVGCHFTQPLCV